MEIMTNFPMIKNWKKKNESIGWQSMAKAISIKSEMKNQEDEI